MNEPTFESSGVSWDFKYPNRKHFYALAKYRIRIHEKWELHPSIFYASTHYGRLLDINTRVFFKEKYFIGAACNNNISPAIQAGIRLWKKFTLAYSYDQQRIGANYRYSHEFSLAFGIDKE